jgi:hypothetical protein
MYETKDNLMGALTGAAAAALTSYVRNEDDLERRLRDTRDEAEEALDLIRELNSRGEVIRSRLPTVNDLQVAMSIASQQTVSPSVIPTSSTVVRPDLTSTMEAAVADLAWPPVPGIYTSKGLVEQAGELTTAFLAMTYEEVRAFVLGLTQSKSPSRDAKLQMFAAANALSSVVAGLKLSTQQYRDAWMRLFTGQVAAPSSGASTADPHRDVARPPIVVAVDGGVAGVTPLGRPDILSHPCEHRNTDVNMKFRVTIPAGSGLNAGTSAFAINFGSEYRTQDNKAIQPTVVISDYRFYASQTTSTGFAVTNSTGLAQGAYDILIAAISG